MKIRKLLAVLAAVMLSASFTACKGSENENSSSEQPQEAVQQTTDAETAEKEQSAAEAGTKTITWLSDYDLNPAVGESRSIALAIFEEKYGGKIEWIPTTNDNKYTDLANSILGGKAVDMFPYTPSVFPDGALNKYFQPLDDYIDLDDEMWSGIKETADSMQYKGAHYAVPYRTEDPVCLIYSRKLVKDEGLSDPYKLYTEGKWDYDAFLSMMKKFTENGDGRYGCAGFIGQPVMQSSGEAVVKYDGTAFTSNLDSPELEKAGILLENITAAGLYDKEWYTSYPDDNSVLFFGAEPWAIPESNGLNPDADIFIVPFPKADGSDKYYTTCSFGAKMLVAGSANPEAVAEFIECERIAETDEKYADLRKKKALSETTDTSGVKLSITEEQYKVLETMKNPVEMTPVFDFGFGMGDAMSKETYDYSTRGAMLNITDALISGYSGSPSQWSELKDSCGETIKKEIKKYN